MVSPNKKIKQKQIDKVIDLYKNNNLIKSKKEALKLLSKDQNNIKVLMLLSALSQILKETEAEKKYLLKLVSLKTSKPAVYNDMGNLYSADGEYDKAKEMFEQAIKIAPNYALACCGLGLVYYNEENIMQAEEMYKQAIAIDQKFSEAYNNLGNLYKKIFEYDKALEMYLLVIKHSPHVTSAYSNLATLYQERKEPLLADAMFQKAIGLNENDVELKFNYALFCLENFDYLKGFDLYRYRYHERKKNNDILLASGQGLLQKNIDIKNKILLISHEQGYGDFIMFMRYIPFFKDMGAKVYVYVNKLLVKLFKTNYPDIDFVSSGEVQTVQYNYRMPLLDAAYILGTTYETIPFQEKYVSIKKDDSSEISKKYDLDNKKVKIGINYQGSILHKNDKNRSIKLEFLLKYLDALDENFQIYSLQYEPSEEDQKLLDKHGIINLGADIKNFYDTALIVDNMDLIVSVDTALVHLCGAMGKEVFVLLPFINSDWRWGVNKTKTNWYRSVTIFRQDLNEKWDRVIKEVVQKIATFTSNEGLMNQAIEYHKANNLQKAEELYRKVLELNPTNADAYHYLGVIAFDLGYSEHAIGLIQEAIRLNPELDEAYENLKAIAQTLKN